MSNYGNIPPVKCPVCANINDDCTCVSEEDCPPRAGDFSMCAKCGEILVFNADLSTRQAGLNDMLKLSPKEAAMLESLQKFARKERICG